MFYSGTGLLLFTKNFETCTKFYKKTLELPVIFEEPGVLTTFKFGSGYLMVEDFGTLSAKKKSFAQNPVILRFDTTYEEFTKSTDFLETKGIELELMSYDWGHTASFVDPDGNCCELYAPLDGMPANCEVR